jgi:hypothetical protein
MQHKRELLKKKNVLTYGEFVGSPEADAEDMFGTVSRFSIKNM